MVLRSLIAHDSREMRCVHLKRSSFLVAMMTVLCHPLILIPLTCDEKMYQCFLCRQVSFSRRTGPSESHHLFFYFRSDGLAIALFMHTFDRISMWVLDVKNNLLLLSVDCVQILYRVAQSLSFSILP